MYGSKGKSKSGMHMMPDGTMMKNSDMKKAKKLKPSKDDKMADAMDRGIQRGMKNFRTR